MPVLLQLCTPDKVHLGVAMAIFDPWANRASSVAVRGVLGRHMTHFYFDFDLLSSDGIGMGLSGHTRICHYVPTLSGHSFGLLNCAILGVLNTCP